MIHFIFFLLLAYQANGQSGNFTECPSPPYNNPIAALIVEGLEAARPCMYTGIPGWNIPPLDPFYFIDNIPFSMENEYIVIDGVVNDTVIYNLAQYIICQVIFDFGLRQEFFMEMRLKELNTWGVYDMDGVYVQIFPIFGTGNYTLDVYNASVYGGARISYNVLRDRAQINNLELDVAYQELVLFMECILGCGSMADIVNQFLSEIATAIFNALWEVLNPILTHALETIINDILYDIKITEVLPPGAEQSLTEEMIAEVVFLKLQEILSEEECPFINETFRTTTLSTVDLN